MQNDLFPQNETTMPDRIWETYCCLVWCNNTLNALAKILRYRAPVYTLYTDKAQGIITFLLEDSGRIEEFKKWQSEHERVLDI